MSNFQALALANRCQPPLPSNSIHQMMADVVVRGGTITVMCPTVDEAWEEFIKVRDIIQRQFPSGLHPEVTRRRLRYDSGVTGTSGWAAFVVADQRGANSEHSQVLFLKDASRIPKEIDSEAQMIPTVSMGFGPVVVCYR